MAFWRFFQSSFKLAAGNLGAQLVSLATAALMGRLFLPTRAGQYYAIFGAAAIAALVSTGRYETAITTVPGRRTAFFLYKLSLTLNAAMLAALLILLLLFELVWRHRSPLDTDLKWLLGIVL